MEKQNFFKCDQGYRHFQSEKFELKFQTNFSSKDCDKNITISEGNCGAFVYPPLTEPVSKIYDIESSEELDHGTVTIKIHHDADPGDVRNLCFISCAESLPPYHFEILDGGHFTDKYGQIQVNHFSKYAIVSWLKHRFKSLVAMFEDSYVALLYCSSKYNNSSWNAYVAIVKNSPIFKRDIKEDIKNDYEENIDLESKSRVIFEEGMTEVEIIANQRNESGWEIDSTTHPLIFKAEIDQYFDSSSPPLIKYKLTIKSCKDPSDINIVFTLRNMRPPKNILKLIKRLSINGK